MQAIQRFGIATCFPITETSTFAEIARACGIPESDTRRILRFAMTFYIFQELSPGVVAHTAASKALAEIGPLGQTVGMLVWERALRVESVHICNTAINKMLILKLPLCRLYKRRIVAICSKTC